MDWLPFRLTPKLPAAPQLSCDWSGRCRVGVVRPLAGASRRPGGLSTGTERRGLAPEDFARAASRISTAVESVIRGKPDVIRLLLTQCH